MKTIAILIILLFAGCGGGSSNTTNTGTVMTNGVLYPVDSGDKIVKTSDEARITVLISTDNDKVEVKLTDGTASLM